MNAVRDRLSAPWALAAVILVAFVVALLPQVLSETRDLLAAAWPADVASLET